MTMNDPASPLRSNIPADPLADPLRPRPQQWHETSTAFDDQRVGMPWLRRGIIEQVELDAPVAVRSDVLRTLAQAQRAFTIADHVLATRRRLETNMQLTPIGKADALLPTVDQARVQVDAMTGVIDDTRREINALKSRGLSAPSDAVAAARAAEIRAALKSMTRADRGAAMFEALELAAKGDRDARETLIAALTAPAVVRLELLPDKNTEFPSMAIEAMDPDRAWAIQWLRWATDLAEFSQRTMVEWLDTLRAGLNAPVPSRH